MTAFNGEGKDKVIFVAKEEHEISSTVKLDDENANEDHNEKGLILSTGEINWDCPCLGGMASGMCGEQFKSAFTCFHLSQEEVKGSNCLDQFIAMQECFRQHPELFPQEDETADPEQKQSSSISDFSPSKQSDTLLTETDEVSSQLPLAS